MHKEILITVEPQERRVAVVEGGTLEEYHVERTAIRRMVGNIYKGKVQSLATAIGAAFVDLGLERSGFLYVSDVVGPALEYEEAGEPVEILAPRKATGAPATIEDVLKKEQEVLVQIVKEPISTKGARLTTKLALPGRYLVLMPTQRHIGVSKRIDEESERTRLKKILKELRFPQHMGLIVRTAGAGRSKREFVRDLRYLLNHWRRIKARAKRSGAPALLHQEHGLVFRVLRDSFGEDVDKVLVDSKEECKMISRFLAPFMPNLRPRLEFYRGDESLFEKKHIETEIERIYNRKVYLKGGSYLVIERTESLVAIDVNTGKYRGKKGVEETVLAVNLAAAREIPRQVRLRDLAGIIVIDFIDMKNPAHRREVFAALEEGLRRDRAKVNILRISELGLVEMTRQRTGKPLESLSYRECPYCQGRGSVKSVTTMAIIALRVAKRCLKETAKGTIELTVHPDVASRLFNEDRGSISFLERRFGRKITIKPDPMLHVEQVKLETAQI